LGAEDVPVSRFSAASRLLQPWAGLVAAVLAGGVAHQFGSEGVFDDCQSVGVGPLQIIALLCIVVALGGGWSSFRLLKNEASPRPLRVIAAVSEGMALLATFATILPIIASLMLPPCFQ
jgi:hypothetical protein